MSETLTVSKAMGILAKRKWAKMTPAQRRAQIKKMVAGRKKKKS